MTDTPFTPEIAGRLEAAGFAGGDKWAGPVMVLDLRSALAHIKELEAREAELSAALTRVRTVVMSLGGYARSQICVDIIAIVDDPSLAPPAPMGGG